MAGNGGGVPRLSPGSPSDELGYAALAARAQRRSGGSTRARKSSTCSIGSTARPASHTCRHAGRMLPLPPVETIVIAAAAQV
eukprot:7959316-Pyramimonas_sp.AAC.1